MLFNSLAFFLFFPIVTIIYFLLPHKARWFHLLLASCVFYMAFIPVYILILFFTIIIDYVAGIVIENAEGKKRKLFLIISLISNIGVLAVFKYYNFLAGSLNGLLAASDRSLPLLAIALPIGLSFHTFQAMSYTIEVYRGHHKAERHFGLYALYVMFYPQLVAGPIERPQNLLYQFRQHKQFDYDSVVNGIKLMMWGLFKKLVVADRLAIITDPIFKDPRHHNHIDILVAAFLFSFQIFCDFSGYSDMAIGAARVMGFRLMKNFDRPYHAKSISEFWKRWHISLSTWFRDYLYISLGGNRVSIPRWYFNIFFVFLVSGFWHGANWTFIAWGALHGFYFIFARVTATARQKINEVTGITKVKWLYEGSQVLVTFTLVMLAWIFFRANNMSDALYMLQQTPLAIADIYHGLAGDVALETKASWGMAFVVIGVLEAIHLLQRKNNILSLINGRPIYVRWALYYAFVLAIVFLGVFDNRQFIYFQF
jgi:alginate O-acetyltransferase complex protein AlgI